MYDHWWLVKLSVKSVVQRNFAYVREFKKYLAMATFYSLWKFIVTIDRKLLYTFPLSFVHRATISVYSFNFYRIKFEMLCSFSSVLKKIYHYCKCIWSPLGSGSMTVMDYCVETEAVPFRDLRGDFHLYKIYSWNSFSTKLRMCQLKNANVESISFFMKYVCKEVWL